MGNFGLARILENGGYNRTARVIGTSGYIPPEYYRGEITTKMDTYSFGVVCIWCLLHVIIILLTGKQTNCRIP